MTRKFIGYFRLMEACARHGCPVCRCVVEDGRRRLEGVTKLTQQLSEATSRAAALHYRLARVAEDRNVLELNLAGERGAHALALSRIDELRRENTDLRAALHSRNSARTDPLG